MKPFVRLIEPEFKNIPSIAENMNYESVMQKCIQDYNSIEAYFDGSLYFVEEDPDDLAYVFEKELKKWRDENGKINLSYTMEVVKDHNDRVIDEYCVDVELLQSACQDLERHLLDHMNRVIRNHLERTGGKIGHFPCRSERYILTYKDDDGSFYHVKFNPEDLYWCKANGYELEKIALYNTPGTSESGVITPEELEEKKQNRRNRYLKSIKKRATIFGISAAIFLITFFGTLLRNKIFGQAELSSLLFISNIICISLTVAIINIVLILKAWREMNDMDAFDSVKLNTEFWTDIGLEYNKQSFRTDMIEYHKFLRFWQLWDERTCRTSTWIKEFYKTVAPFVVNGEQYIP